VLAALVLVAGSVGAVLGADAGSPLWDTRVALEDVAASLRLSTDDRVAYLFELVQSRTEEAARQDAAGHPDAAAKARAAAASAVLALDGNIPQIETPVPAEAPTASPPPANSPSPSPSLSASGSPAAHLPASGSPSAPPRSSLPTPVRTEPPRTATPTPTATTTKQTVTIAGSVRDASGVNVTGACVTWSPTMPTLTTQCLFKTTNGSYGFTVQASTSYTVTLYAYWISPSGQAFSGSATSQLSAPTTVMPGITLTPRR
jgi:hypothetical protein